MKQKGIHRRKTKAKVAPPQKRSFDGVKPMGEVNLAMLGSEDAASRSEARSDKKMFSRLSSRMTKRKVVDRVNTRRSEGEAQASKNTTCDEFDETQVKMARCSIELEIGGGS